MTLSWSQNKLLECLHKIIYHFLLRYSILNSVCPNITLCHSSSWLFSFLDEKVFHHRQAQMIQAPQSMESKEKSITLTSYRINHLRFVESFFYFIIISSSISIIIIHIACVIFVDVCCFSYMFSKSFNVQTNSKYEYTTKLFYYDVRQPSKMSTGINVALTHHLYGTINNDNFSLSSSLGRWRPWIESAECWTTANHWLGKFRDRIHSDSFEQDSNSWNNHGNLRLTSTVLQKIHSWLFLSILQYKTEKDGVIETRVEQKITIQSDGDPIDHDKALAEAIQVIKCKALHWNVTHH